MTWDFVMQLAVPGITGHFVLGFGVGLLVYWLTSITSLRMFGLTIGETGPSTGRYVLLLAVSLSIVFHVLEDYGLQLF